MCIVINTVGTTIVTTMGTVIFGTTAGVQVALAVERTGISANFTAAQERNIEKGVFLESPDMARRLRGQFARIQEVGGFATRGF